MLHEDDLLKDSLGFQLGVTYRKLVHAFQMQLRPFDITTEQWSVLYQVYREDGVIQKLIAERLYKDRPTITRLLGQLESKGWVHRSPGLADKRSVAVRITPAGAALIRDTYPHERQLMTDMRTSLGNTAYEDLLALLRQAYEQAQHLSSDRE